MEKRRLGRTGHKSSVAILGGAAYARCTPDQAAPSFADALFRGVNHLDIAPGYGEAEANIGPLIPEVRERLFIGCKTGRKHPDGVRAQAEESLRRLQTDHFDLYQLHGVTDLDELEARVDAAEILVRLRDEGIARHIGITGHDLGSPAAQLEAVKRWDLDTVMFPLNPRLWNDTQYRQDAQALLTHCRTADVGVQIIKVGSLAPWKTTPDHETWYRPQTDTAKLKRNVDFVLSTPGVTCMATPGDRSLIGPFLDAVANPGFVTASKRRAMISEAATEPLIFPLRDHAKNLD